jgi:Mg-chelatase subunit ChlI
MENIDGLEDVFKVMEDFSEEQLRNVIVHANELITDMKKTIRKGYEEEFIRLMINCGLDMLNARINLIDFKAVAAAYLEGKEPVYIEDIEYAMEVVLRKNGYVPTYEGKKMINEFLENTFGQNIPSMVGSLVI